MRYNLSASELGIALDLIDTYRQGPTGKGVPVPSENYSYASARDDGRSSHAGPYPGAKGAGKFETMAGRRVGMDSLDYRVSTFY